MKAFQVVALVIIGIALAWLGAGYGIAYQVEIGVAVALCAAVLLMRERVGTPLGVLLGALILVSLGCIVATLAAGHPVLATIPFMFALMGGMSLTLRIRRERAER